eukprot:SAG31_NODE_46637_length_253_cov_1.012987_1_plen_21_part_10
MMAALVAAAACHRSRVVLSIL